MANCRESKERGDHVRGGPGHIKATPARDQTPRDSDAVRSNVDGEPEDSEDRGRHEQMISSYLLNATTNLPALT
jgi:hypothetical protein